MDNSIIYSDATKLAELIRTREVTSVEVVQAHLDRIEAVNPQLNAIVALADGALDAAEAADEALAAGAKVGPLHGVPSRSRTPSPMSARGRPDAVADMSGLCCKFVVLVPQCDSAQDLVTVNDPPTSPTP